MKSIRIIMPDGAIFELDSQVVIDDRAGVLANSDSQRGLGDYDEIKAAEQFPGDDDILDWLKNNMNWSDIEHLAVQRVRPELKPDYNSVFGSAEISIWK